MDKVGGYKNYGYGKQLFYAGKQALLDRYGEGCFSTRHSHAERWRLFVNFLKANQINDTRKITKDTVEQYAELLKEKVNNKELAVSTAQNRLSTVNVILQTMRQDTVLKLSPRQWVGERQHIRQTVPASLQILPDQYALENNQALTNEETSQTSPNIVKDFKTFYNIVEPFKTFQNNVKDCKTFYYPKTSGEGSANAIVNPFFNQVIQQLNESGQQRLASLVLLTRHIDLRFREASLLDAVKAHGQAERLGRINITEGTKGGRGKSISRWIPVNKQIIEIIKQAANLQRQDNNNNLIPKNKTFAQWENHCRYQWRKANDLVIQHYAENPHQDQEISGIKGFHDMRAAYACQRYQQITGYPAPVAHSQQQRTAPRKQDREARQILAKELGHNRPSVLVHYIGSAK